MAVGVIAAQRESAESLGCAGLQATVVTARAGAKLVDATEALVERLVVDGGRKAANANCLIAVQLHLVSLMDGAGADIAHPQ